MIMMAPAAKTYRIARRQRQQERVVEDSPTATEELYEEQQEAPVEDRSTDVEGFLGGSHDTSVLRDYENHIAIRIWNGEERPELKLSSHERKMAKFRRLALEIEGLVAVSGLSPVIACSLDTGDRRLMFAFVERWHKETSSFHLPVGEVTISLDDVALLLHLPIVGAFHSFEQLHVGDAVETLVELLESATYAWGAAALVHMYDNLNEVSKSTARQLAGYITPLQCWIYKHFSSVGSALAAEDYDERRSCTCQWISGKALPMSTYHRCLDRLTPDVVCWIPYGDHRSFREFEVITFFGHLRWGPLTVIHRPEKVVRQFGYIQTIPPHLATPSVSFEEMDDRWMQFSDYIAPVGKICVVSGQCSPYYMDWFYMISHLFMSSTQLGDPPRVSLVQQYDTFVEPDVHQQPVAAATLNKADADVHHLGHAVDAFAAIVDKLKRLLNRRILTNGTKAYIVAEECVGITRRFIRQPVLAHRSRHRRRTNVH
ncbi:Protein MAIN-LIKE 2 [Glycine soja]